MAENNTWGKIITRETADLEFGLADYSIPVTSGQIQSFASKTRNLLMFGIINQELVVLGDNRIIIYPDGYVPPQDKIFKVFSKNLVLELFGTGSEVNNFIELRSDTLTITSGDKTLEYGSLCPPFCEMPQ